MAITNTQAARVANFIAGSQTVPETSPTQYWLGLYTGSVASIDGTVTGEILSNDSTGYSRVFIANNKTSFSTATNNGVVGNLIDVQFPESKSSWGTIAGVAIFPTQTATNCIYFYNFPIPKNVDANTTVFFRGNSDPSQADIVFEVTGT